MLYIFLFRGTSLRLLQVPDDLPRDIADDGGSGLICAGRGRA